MDVRETLDEPVEAIAQSVEINIDSDGAGARKDKQKRVVKLTAKALAEKLERLQASRKAKLNKAGNLREKMQVLMQTNEKVTVQCVSKNLLICVMKCGISIGLWLVFCLMKKKKSTIYGSKQK